MGEYLLKDYAKKNNLDVNIASAGVAAVKGHGASIEVQNLLAEKNIDASSHVARQISTEIINKSDIILAAEDFHKYTLRKLSPGARGKIFLLGAGGNQGVADPQGKDDDFFVTTLTLIEQGLEYWQAKLFG